MTKKDRNVLEGLVTQVADLAGCVVTLQKLTTHHHHVIKRLVELQEEQARVQPPL